MRLPRMSHNDLHHNYFTHPCYRSLQGFEPPYALVPIEAPRFRVSASNLHSDRLPTLSFHKYPGWFSLAPEKESKTKLKTFHLENIRSLMGFSMSERSVPCYHKNLHLNRVSSLLHLKMASNNQPCPHEGAKLSSRNVKLVFVVLTGGYKQYF